MSTGIITYGLSIPRFRLAIEETWNVWRNAMLKLLKHQLFVSERAVTGPNQNVVTLGVEAAQQAIGRAQVGRLEIDALIFGTCTNPEPYYPLAIEVAKTLHLDHRLFTVDVQFSTKSGTGAIQIGYALVRSGRARQVLTVGSDTINRMTAPGTVAEYAASSAAGAAIIGTEGIIAEIEATLSYATDLSDEFRVAGEQHIRSGGFQALASSLESDFGIKAHMVEAVRRFFDQQHMSPADFNYAVFQQPYGIVPFSLGEALQFDLSKITPGCTAYELGNCGSASVLIGLGNILDIAKPDDRILVASYGSGAGCDVLGLRVTDEIEKHKGRWVPVEDLIADKQMLDYATAMVYEDKCYGSRR